MADDNRFRSNPPHGQRWPSQAAPGAGDAGSRNKANDPLAELARLIGQTDPFGELKQGAPRAAPARPTVAPPQPAHSDPYGSPLHFSDFDAPHGNAQPAYDPAAYGTAQQHDPHSGGYYDDRAHAAHGDEHYDDYEDRPRRRWLKLAVATAALVVVGVGGVYGYRMIFKGGLSGPPPVIKANSAPSKVAPAPTAADASNKIYARVGEGSAQGERVVSREEKPVEVKAVEAKDASRPVPRVVFPNVQTSSASQEIPVSAPLNTDPGGPDPASAEPKRIRTVTIRPDGTGSTAAPSRPAPAQPAPAPAAQSNAPLSLNPQGATADASAARPVFPPAPKPAAAPPTRLAAVPPATGVAAGSYTVQISSQRSENEAQASFRSLAAKYPNLLGNRQPIIRRADLGEKGIYFRTMVGPFASVDEASQFCGSLKSAGAQCVVQRN